MHCTLEALPSKYKVDRFSRVRSELVTSWDLPVNPKEVWEGLVVLVFVPCPCRKHISMRVADGSSGVRMTTHPHLSKT